MVIQANKKLPATPIECSRALSPQTLVLNLHSSYKKPHCKGEPYRFSRYQDPSLNTHTDKHLVTLM